MARQRVGTTHFGSLPRYLGVSLLRYPTPPHPFSATPSHPFTSLGSTGAGRDDALWHVAHLVGAFNSRLESNKEEKEEERGRSSRFSTHARWCIKPLIHKCNGSGRCTLGCGTSPRGLQAPPPTPSAGFSCIRKLNGLCMHLIFRRVSPAFMN